MAGNSILAEHPYPCKAAPIAELDEMFQRIIYDTRDKTRNLSEYFHPIPQNKIHKEQIRHLRIAGDADDNAAERFPKAGLPRGFYLNADGTLLLVVLPETPHLGNYFTRYGSMAESLWIFNSQMYGRDFRKTPNLKELVLHSNPLLDSLDHLDKLTQLTGLYIYECPRLTTLPGLECLTQLTKLTLSGCTNLTAVPALRHLTQLTRLNLSGCERLTTLPSLENLTQLTELNLYECRSLTQLPGLENLTQLTKLHLVVCKSLTQLPGLENLTRLTKLDLMVCKSLTQLPSLENFTQLTKLDLTGCRSLTQLPGLENLTQLTELNLLGCVSLTTLPEGLRNCGNLRSLNLSFMNLQDFPDWLPDIAEGFSRNPVSPSGKDKAIVSLYGTTVDSIQDMSLFEQPYEMVVEWFRKRAQGKTQPLNEIKVVFLGDGEAGKSHTIARLMNDGGDPIDYTDKSTPGIVIKHKDYEKYNRKFRVNYWDFGGQEIMHSMHRIFLTGRTMYVVLLNARDDTQGDRARYWLHNIQSFAPNAPVLLVLNKIDQNPKASVDERTLRSRYPGLTRVVSLSALDFDREQFNTALTDVLLNEINETGFLDAQWPNNWIEVKRRLENMTTHYIRGSDYRAICEECQVGDVQTDLLHWFNDLGVSFCFCDKDDYALKKHVILRPDWITNGLYIILFNDCAGAVNGLIPHRSIYDLLERSATDPAVRRTLSSATYDNPGDVEYVLGVMRKFQLSLTTSGGKEFIPMLCQQDSKVDLHNYERDEKLLEFRMNFEYLPDNLLHRLMVDRHSELDMNNVWRTGARFEIRELGLSAVVVIDGNDLRFFIRHNNDTHRPNTYLTMLKTNVDRIVEKMGLKAPTCQLIYKLDGKQDVFDFETLKAMQKAGQSQVFSMTWLRMMPIEDILNQSAPKGSVDAKKLLEGIIRSCGHLQDDPIYRLIPNPNGRGYTNGQGMEDLRNRRIRDDLSRDYHIGDQTQRGLSGTGESIGELDMLVSNGSDNPWTIIEALRVNNTSKTEWNKHLEKLCGNYNTRGFTTLYLLTYVDADTTAFARIWKSYQNHIRKHNPGQLRYADGSFEEQEVPNHQYTKVVKCHYSGGVDPIAVYHIFVRIPTQNG